MTNPSDYTRTQRIVLRAISEVRALEGTLAARPTDVENATRKHNNGNKIGRQNWNPSGTTDPRWLAINDAIKGRLPVNDPVEVAIRSLKGREAPAELMQMLEDKLEEVTGELAKAEKTRDKATEELKEFKERCYVEQCEDALYRIHFEQMMAKNKILTEAASNDQKIISGLRAEKSQLEEQLNAFGAVDGAENGDQKTKKLRPPRVIEPKLAGANPDESVTNLLARYTDEIDIGLDDLKKAAVKETLVDIAIVFHRFNIDGKRFYETEIPFRNKIPCRLVFSCFAPTGAIRRKIYQAAAILSTYPPHVVLVDGTGKVVHLPAEKRTNETDHEWFVAQATSGNIKAMKADILAEGYEYVVVRRVGDE